MSHLAVANGLSTSARTCSFQAKKTTNISHSLSPNPCPTSVGLLHDRRIGADGLDQQGGSEALWPEGGGSRDGFTTPARVVKAALVVYLVNRPERRAALEFKAAAALLRAEGNESRFAPSQALHHPFLIFFGRRP